MRLGRIGYINCAPVYGAIDREIVRAPGELVTGTPAELNDLLVAGELDVSVISAVEYARHARDLVLRDAADGAVTRNSDVGKVKPKFAEARAEAQDLEALAALPHEAVLVIGDAALTLAAHGTYPHRYDLGAEWKTWTGLPFVFAVWAARRSADRDAVRRGHEALLVSRAWGLAHLDELAADAARATGVPLDACREYLGGLDYAFTYKHLAGLTDFFRRLAADGIVPDGSLQFLQVA